MNTTLGTIAVEFFDDDAPKTVANFRKLAADGFYDGIIFHRVIPDFMIQGGARRAPAPAAPGTRSRTSSTSTRWCAARWRWPTPAQHQRLAVLHRHHRQRAVARRQAHGVRSGHGRDGRRRRDRGAADRRPGPSRRSTGDRVDRARPGVAWRNDRHSRRRPDERHPARAGRDQRRVRAHDRGREPGDRGADHHDPGARGRRAGRDGRARTRGAAGVGGARLRGPRADHAPGAEVDLRQRRPGARHGRLRDRQDLRGRAARRLRLHRVGAGLLGQGGPPSTWPTSGSRPGTTRSRPARS